jgi:integrase
MASLRTGIGETARRAGFPDGDITPYVFRHTTATWLAQDGVPLFDIVQLLGHTHTRMVERTDAHFHRDYQKRASSTLTPRLAGLDWTGPNLPERPIAAGVSLHFEAQRPAWFC